MGNIKIKIFIFSILFYYVISGYVTLVDEDSKYQNQLYRNFFSISNDSMTYEANGGEFGLSNALYQAFSDESKDKGWISVGSQGKEYTNSKTKIKYDSLTNHIIITFDKTSLISKMIYRSMSIVHTCPIIGYPKRLKVYYRMRNEEGGFNQDENDFILADDITSNATNKTVLFNFDSTFKCDQIKLEWNQTSYCSKNPYDRKASAAEIKLLIPETENINENIIHAFTDYNRLTLSKEFDDKNFINQLKEEIKILDFSPYPKKYIERIEGVFKGSIFFNPKREFATNINSGKSNVIYQRGNIYSYARNKLLLSRAGTSRQVTGIYGRANESITIYVTVENDDPNTPLPCVVFTQFAGDRVNWKGKEKCLKLGEQKLIFDDFEVENYKYKVNPGGPIYIINNYLPEEQSQNIKIYIDDGILFPIFKLGDNEENYIQDLRLYIESLNFNQDTYEDLTELVSDNMMISVRASDAYKIYSDGKKGPQKNLLAWDAYLKQIYSFYGIQLNRNEKDFDIRNEYINIHLRFNQPLETYAVTEYIGIHIDEWVEKSLYIVGQETDWDFTCQIADMMDIRETFIFKILNKFTAKYSQIVIKGEEENNEQNYLYEEKLKYLSADEIESNMRGSTYDDTKKCKGFLQNKLNNYLIFWDLESYSHGFWAKVQNLYRNEYESTSKLTTTERMVYFCSVAMGIDLGYYFTRWGFYLEGLRNTIFNETNASKDYQSLISQDISSGKIEKKIKKFWYLDNEEYNFMNGNGIGCYEDNNGYDTQIEGVSGYNGEYVILLPKIGCRGHLGFEIYENDKLIGFSYGREYIDKNVYENNYTPKYNIIAYDRLLQFSEPSKYISP